MKLSEARLAITAAEEEIHAAKAWLRNGAASSKEDIARVVSFLQGRFSKVRKLKLAVERARLHPVSSSGGACIADTELLVQELSALAETNLELGTALSSLVKEGVVHHEDVNISGYFEEYTRLSAARLSLEETLAVLEITTDVSTP